METADLSAQTNELSFSILSRLGTDRKRRLDSRERQPEQQADAATDRPMGLQKLSRADSSQSSTWKTVASWVICRMSVTFGDRFDNLSCPPRFVTVV